MTDIARYVFWSLCAIVTVVTVLPVVLSRLASPPSPQARRGENMTAAAARGDDEGSSTTRTPTGIEDLGWEGLENDNFELDAAGNLVNASYNPGAFEDLMRRRNRPR